MVAIIGLFIQILIFAECHQLCSAFIKTFGQYQHFIKANTLQTFGIEDILSENDLVVFQERFRRLQEIFPRVTERDLTKIITSSPMFLTMNPENFEEALSIIAAIYPAVDPSYIIQQKSPGLELLLSTMSGNFDFSGRQSRLHNIIGHDRNVTEFIHRIPHALLPRYAARLESQVETFRRVFPTTCRNNSATIFSIVEKWPSILSIVDLEASILELDHFFKKQNLSFQEKELFMIIKGAPQALQLSSSMKRFAFIKSQFPRWDHSKVIVEYPKVLTWASDSLDTHYQVRSH